MKTDRTNMLWNVLGCAVFLSLPFVFPYSTRNADLFDSSAALRLLIGNALVIAFYYVNYYNLIPEYYLKGKFFGYALYVAMSFAVIVMMPSIVTGRNPVGQTSSPALVNGRVPQYNFVEEIGNHATYFAAALLFSILPRKKDQLFEVQAARHLAELNSLKDQIGSQFIVNGLNDLYALALREKSYNTATGILKVSDMIRYVSTETRAAKVALGKELTYIQDYVDLQRLKIDRRVYVSFTINGTVQDQRIVPFLLMPFIENAFKHGVNPAKDSRIEITIDVTSREVKLVVENNKVVSTRQPQDQHGLAIQYIKTKLELMYPEQHSLIVSDSEKYFLVQLIIDLV